MKRLTSFLFHIAVLAAVSMPFTAEAQTLDKVLEGKKVVMQGVCEAKDKETLSTSKEDVNLLVPCVMGIDFREPGINTIGFQDDDGYYVIIRVDTSDKTQKVIWRRGLNI